MKKALMVASVASMIKQFNMNNIEILLNLGYELTVATNFTSPGTMPLEESEILQEDLLNRGIRVINLDMQRNPLGKKNICVYKYLKKLINEEKFDLIHCHSPIGGVLTRSAAINARRKDTVVIYTAHGFHFFKGAPLINWCVFYPIEWLLSNFTDLLITINHEDYSRARKHFKFPTTISIPGVGIDIDRITRPDKIKIILDDFEFSSEDFLVLSVGELTENKNHETVIRAIAELDDKNVYYLIAGQGHLKEYLKEIASECGILNRVKFLGYRKDIYDVYHSADLFVFPSFREGLSVALMEAMASELPVIASKIRGNTDLIDHDSGGYLVGADKVEEYVFYLNNLINNPKKLKSMGAYNKNKSQKYSSKIIDRCMTEIYKDPKKYKND